MSHHRSLLPASITNTLWSGFSLSRLASTQPADPPPMMIVSKTLSILIRRFDVSQFHINAFQLGIILNSGKAVLPALTGLFISAKRKFNGGYIIIINPADTCLQLMNYAMATFDVIRKYACRKPVGSIIGSFNHLFF